MGTCSQFCNKHTLDSAPSAVVHVSAPSRTKWCATVEPEQCCLKPGPERLVHQRSIIYHGVRESDMSDMRSRHSLHDDPARFPGTIPIVHAYLAYFRNVAPRHSHTTQPTHRGTGTTDHDHPGMRPSEALHRRRESNRANRPQGVGTALQRSCGYET